MHLANVCIHTWRMFQAVFLCVSKGTQFLYTLRRKGSILNLKRFYHCYVFGTPKRFYTLLKKWFLWVLYRTLGFHTWPIEPFTKKKKWFYIEPFLEFHI